MFTAFLEPALLDDPLAADDVDRAAVAADATASAAIAAADTDTAAADADADAAAAAAATAAAAAAATAAIANTATGRCDVHRRVPHRSFVFADSSMSRRCPGSRVALAVSRK